jgi:RHS repeat-associated protein
LEDDIGLYYYGARWSPEKAPGTGDPAAGRFIQADTDVPESQGVQAYDRYAYANNNPVKYTDPSGHFAWLPVITLGGALIGAVVNYTSQVVNNFQSNGVDLGSALTTNIDVGSIANSALVGAAAGFSAGVLGPAALAVVGDALTGVGLVSGSTTIFSAGMTASGAAVSLGTAIYEGSTSVSSTIQSASLDSNNSFDTLQPGPYAGESIPARGPGQIFTTAERNEIDRIGYSTGCHTCGSTNPGTVSGHFIPDHQPPSVLNYNNSTQYLYPQCIECSRRQGGQALELWRRNGRR